jgi:hypothetical protein
MRLAQLLPMIKRKQAQVMSIIRKQIKLWKPKVTGYLLDKVIDVWWMKDEEVLREKRLIEKEVIFCQSEKRER